MGKDKARPDMGSYQTATSFDKTQRHKRVFSFCHKKRTTYLDDALKNKAGIPGIGKYVMEELDKKLSKGPSRFARKRN